MERLYFINSLPENLRKVYYNAMTSDKLISDKEWDKIKEHIEKFRDTNVSEDEIINLMKCQSSEEKEVLIDCIKKNHKYNYLIKKNVFTFEDIINVETSIIEEVLKEFSMSEIVKACMAASPCVVSFIKDYVDNEEFNEIKKSIGFVSIKDITCIHDLIIEKINSRLYNS